MEIIFLKNLFTSDLHGNVKKYRLFLQTIEKEQPDGVFIGGDILPNTYAIHESAADFIEKQLFQPLQKIRENLQKNIRCFVILGNDDPRINEDILINADKNGIIDYVHFKTVQYHELFVSGYSFVPPTPFQLKDWEKYDISRYVDINSVSPEEGIRSIPVEKDLIRFSTIKADLDVLAQNAPPKKTIFLFHAPPYNSLLDRAGLDGKTVDYAPLDVHIGSVAIQRFIAKYKPFITLHGHVHETVNITGHWNEKIGSTHAFTGTHEHAEFYYISFDTNHMDKAYRTEMLL
jgi:uncharacterized protein